MLLHKYKLHTLTDIYWGETHTASYKHTYNPRFAKSYKKGKRIQANLFKYTQTQMNILRG